MQVKKNIIIIAVGLLIFINSRAFTYEQSSIFAGSENAPSSLNLALRETDPVILPQEKPIQKMQEQDKEISSVSNLIQKKISVDFKDADIQNILRVLALKAGVNIVADKDVAGTVTIKLADVGWDTALDVILKTNDFGYERRGDIITVMPLEKLTAQKEAEKRLEEVQPLVTEVFTLKYLDAEDVKATLEPQLSNRGKITVMRMSTQAGWKFLGGEKELKKLERVEEIKNVRSKMLVISDIPPYIEKFKKIIETLDVEPKQILIEARIMEVNEDALRDIGFDWGTGASGAESSTISTMTMEKNKEGEIVQGVGGHILSDQITPSVFGPEASAITTTNTGLKVLYKRLRGNQFEVMLHALEESVDANTLSAPRILTLNNQEATILVGTKYPILTSSTEEGVVTTTLDYYQDIGIQLNVAPQICADNTINMIIHPAITSYETTVGTNAYPIITTREAETSVLMKDGETIAIGGLLKDVKKEGVVGVPFLKDIPLLGNVFKRNTNDIEKIDLLIFISARIIRPGELSEEEMAALEGWNLAYEIESDMIKRKLKAVESARKKLKGWRK